MPVPAARLVRDRLTWLAYAQLGVWGYFLYGFEPVVPLLRTEQHTSRTVASLHGTALAVGGVFCALVMPWLIRRVPRQTLLWAGLAGVGAGTLGLWRAHALAATLGCVVLAAFFGSIALNVIIAALADRHGPAGPAAISEANAVAAAVGVLAPLVVGGSVALGWGWRPGLAVVVGVIGALALAAGALRVRVPAATRVSTMDGAGTGRLPRRYWLAWLVVTATGAVEVSMNLWVSDVLRTRAGVAPGTATAAVSAILAGMFVGRVIGGRLVLRFAVAAVLLGAVGLSAAGFAVFWLATEPWLALAGLVVCGLGNSLHYPLGIGLAVMHSDGQPDLAAVRATYAIGLAFGLAPFLLGAVADTAGPHRAFLLVPVFLAVAAFAVARLWTSGRSALDGEREPVTDGQQHRVDPGIGTDDLVERNDVLRLRGLPGIQHAPVA